METPLQGPLLDRLDESAPRWRLADELPLATLDAVPGVARLQTQLLHNRGVSGPEAVAAYLASDWRAPHAPLPGETDAVARLRQAIAAGERIRVFGDYDTDGMTSCATLLLALRALGAQADPYVPRREDDGRGLNIEAVRELAAGGAQLIVTTDCGSANVAEVALARSLGLEVIVTDHHPPQGETPACLIVNPQLACASADSATGAAGAVAVDPPERDLAGVGVAFRVAQALLAGSPTLVNAALTADVLLESLLDLVVIGTIGDVVPLTASNRALARAGLARLAQAPRVGLRALLQRVNLTAANITERDISFALAPRLNAGARLGEPLTALHLLITDDAGEAQRLAARLDTLNQQRQQLTDQMMTQARIQAAEQMAQPDAPPLTFVVGDAWHFGVIGLAASKLSEEFGRPAVVISRVGDECRGSARGPEGFNLVEALAERPEVFKRFGGHARAAGFTIDVGELSALRERLITRLKTRNTSALPSDEHSADGTFESAPARSTAQEREPLLVDCRLPLNRLTLDTYRVIRKLAPFGMSNPEPLFVAQGARLMRCWQSGVEGRNLRLALRDRGAERVFLWARQGALCPQLRATLPTLPLFDVVYSLDAYARSDGEMDLTPRIVALRPLR
ncbi:MAG: single-stranded-DNA-specific exonuclease RecJ [Ktedonobacterales bacterium]